MKHPVASRGYFTLAGMILLSYDCGVVRVTAQFMQCILLSQNQPSDAGNARTGWFFTIFNFLPFPC